MARVAVAVAALLACLALAPRCAANDEKIRYARVQAWRTSDDGSLCCRRVSGKLVCCDDLLPSASTGVFALYGPQASVTGRLVVARPSTDGCQILPPEDRPTEPFVILAQLTAFSNCTWLEQGLLAEAAGAAGLINMADQRTNFIYLMDQQTDDLGLPIPTIPSVAMSGLAGLNLSLAVSLTDVTVDVRAPYTEFRSPLWIHLVIYLIAVTVLALVIVLFSQIIRRVLAHRALTARARARSRAALRRLDALPITTLAEKPPEHDTCAVCLDGFNKGDKVRTLPCSHYYHPACIDPWLQENQTCPLCKFDIVELGYPEAPPPPGTRPSGGRGGEDHAPGSGTDAGVARAEPELFDLEALSNEARSDSGSSSREDTAIWVNREDLLRAAREARAATFRAASPHEMYEPLPDIGAAPVVVGGAGEEHAVAAAAATGLELDLDTACAIPAHHPQQLRCGHHTFTIATDLTGGPGASDSSDYYESSSEEGVDEAGRRRPSSGSSPAREDGAAAAVAQQEAPQPGSPGRVFYVDSMV